MQNYFEQENTQGDSDIEQLRAILGKQLSSYKKKLQAEQKEHYLSLLKDLEGQFEQADKEARELYENTLEEAASINSENLRARRIAMAEKLYKDGIEFRKKLLNDFIANHSE